MKNILAFFIIRISLILSSSFHPLSLSLSLLQAGISAIKHPFLSVSLSLSNPLTTLLLTFFTATQKTFQETRVSCKNFLSLSLSFCFLRKEKNFATFLSFYLFL